VLGAMHQVELGRELVVLLDVVLVPCSGIDHIFFLIKTPAFAANQKVRVAAIRTTIQ
jgi:hypothetical protein